jgi:predicted RNase H-like HicB family nuclease
VPGFAGAHTEAETLDEMRVKLREVLETRVQDGETELIVTQE